jgi:hypothetical protein
MLDSNAMRRVRKMATMTRSYGHDVRCNTIFLR